MSNTVVRRIAGAVVAACALALPAAANATPVPATWVTPPGTVHQQLVTSLSFTIGSQSTGVCPTLILRGNAFNQGSPLQAKWSGSQYMFTCPGLVFVGTVTETATKDSGVYKLQLNVPQLNIGGYGQLFNAVLNGQATTNTPTSLQVQFTGPVGTLNGQTVTVNGTLAVSGTGLQ